MHRWLTTPTIHAALLLLLLGIVGCEPRTPLSRGQAAAIADNVQRQNGVNWGDPVEVLPPPPSSPDGHRWWQVRYREDRIILVDADTAWGRLPPPGYVPVVRATDSHPTEHPQVLLVEGSFVLQLTPPAELDGDHLGALEREAVHLNALAVQSGLLPVFSVRTDHQGRSSLLYGWQGDRGIAQDPHISEWVTVHAPNHAATWVDLLP
jgi:hypothetical protein